MKKVLKVINAEIDRLFSYVNNLRQDAVGMYQTLDDHEKQIAGLEGIVTAYIGKYDGEDEKITAEHFNKHYGHIVDLQNRLVSIENYLVNHVDPQLAYGDTSDEQSMVESDYSALAGLSDDDRVTFLGQCDKHGIDIDPKSDTVDYAQVTAEVVDEIDAEQKVRLDPMHNPPEPSSIHRANPFYAGPANRPPVADAYRYRVAESLSGGDPIVRNDIHSILTKLSEHDIKALMVQCEDRAIRCSNTFTLNQAFITE